MQRKRWFSDTFSFFNIVMVAVIIMVVVSILQPVFRRTSCGEGRKSSCQNNMKQYAIALQQYCSDYDDMLPSSNLVRHSKKWNRVDFVRFATIRGELPINKEVKLQTLYQVLYSYWGENKYNFICPSDPSDHSSPNSQVSYWYKLAIDKAWYGEGCSKPYRRLSDFELMADQIVFYEQKCFHDAGTGRAPGLKNGVRINAAYIDSHIKNITLVNCNKPAESKVRITDPTAPGEPAYFNCKYNASKLNPPPPHIPTTYVDPHKYIDKF